MDPQHHRFYMQAAATQQLLSTPTGAANSNTTSVTNSSTATSSTSSSPGQHHQLQATDMNTNGAGNSDTFNPVAAAVCHLANLANSFSTNSAVSQISPIGATTQPGFQSQQTNSFYPNQHGLK